MKLTLLINNSVNGLFIGQIKEYPAVISQGSSIEELKENIQEVLELYLEDLNEIDKTDVERLKVEEIVLAERI